MEASPPWSSLLPLEVTTKDLASLSLEGYHERFDEIEAHLATFPQQEMPVEHLFTPGLYCRQIFMPARTLLTSKIHRTEHPFVISKGVVSVWDKGRVEILRAPHHGVTYPGTRRILYIHEDTIWTTFHPTSETDPQKIEDVIIEKRDAHYRHLLVSHNEEQSP